MATTTARAGIYGLLGFRPEPSGSDGLAPRTFILHQGFSITNENLRRATIADCLDDGISLVIMENLIDIHQQAGIVIEEEWKVVMAAMKAFCEAGITLVVLHHTSKPGIALRGSSVIEAGFDSIVKIERIDTNTFRMLPSKTRSVGENGVWTGCTITVGKDDDGRLVLDASAQIAPTPTPSEVVIQANEERLTAKWDNIQNLVLRHLGVQESMTETALALACGGTNRDKRIFTLVLSDMVKTGRLGKSKKGEGEIGTACLVRRQIMRVRFFSALRQCAKGTKPPRCHSVWVGFLAVLLFGLCGIFFCTIHELPWRSSPPDRCTTEACGKNSHTLLPVKGRARPDGMVALHPTREQIAQY